MEEQQRQKQVEAAARRLKREYARREREAEQRIHPEPQQGAQPEPQQGANTEDTPPTSSPADRAAPAPENSFAALGVDPPLELVEEVPGVQQAPQEAIMANYDARNETDEAADIMSKLNHIKVPWPEDNDLEFYFSQLEQQMQVTSVKKQWTKRLVLSNNLPAHIQQEVKPLLRMQETAAGATAYKALKDRLLKIFGPKKEAAMQKALGLTLTTTPSQLARQLLDLLCKKDPPLTDCCCENSVSGLWRKLLPNPVQRAIAGMEMTADNLEAILQKADDVYATMVPNAGPQVAANNWSANQGGGAQRGARGCGRGQRGRGGAQSNAGQQRAPGQNGQAGGNQSNPTRAQRHSDNPPTEACVQHWKYGKGAYYCRKPKTCPWRDYLADEPSA